MTERLFGTDGVRGVANSELTAELAFRLGRAGAAELALTGGDRPVVLVGRDPRRSGDLLESALVAGLLSAGADVLRLGVVTTPAVAHLVRTGGYVAGVMVSASHNPAEYNGIKFFSADGFKLPDATEDRIEQRIRRDDCGAPRPTGAQVGRCVDEAGLVDRYVEYVVGTVRNRLDGLKLVVDCAHGAAYRLGPAVLRRLGAEVIAIHDRPDGLNINAGCGSTHPEALAAAVVQHGADAGVAFDGDADRAILVDHRGEIVDGDAVLAVVGLARLRDGRLPGGTVVATVLSNGGLEAALRQAGGRLVRTAVGDRYVVEAMQRGGYLLGGEQSGHIVFADLSTTGDGVLTACQVFELVAAGAPLRDLAAAIRRFPQLQVNVRVTDRAALRENAAVAAALAEAETALGLDGRVVLRPSGTEPLVRIMVEGPDRASIEQVAGRLADVIRRELGVD